MMELAQAIQALGMTQAQAAMALGVTPARVFDLVRGQVELVFLDSLMDMEGSSRMAPTVMVASAGGHLQRRASTDTKSGLGLKERRA